MCSLLDNYDLTRSYLPALKQILRDRAPLLIAPFRRAIKIAWIFGALATVSVVLNWLFPSEVQPEFAERLFLRMIGGWLFNIITGYWEYSLTIIVAMTVMRLIFRHPIVELVYKLLVYICACFTSGRFSPIFVSWQLCVCSLVGSRT